MYAHINALLITALITRSLHHDKFGKICFIEQALRQHRTKWPRTGAKGNCTLLLYPEEWIPSERVAQEQHRLPDIRVENHMDTQPGVQRADHADSRDDR